MGFEVERVPASISLSRCFARSRSSLGQSSRCKARQWAQSKGEIAGFEIGRLRLGTARQENAISELRDIQYRGLELDEQRRALSERLSRLEIRAPVGVVVYGSTVFADLAVVQPAEPLMYVIPQDQPLVISARVEAIHVDQVHVGQEAALRFSAFNQCTTPELFGNVISISADAFQEEVSLAAMRVV